MLKKQTVNEDKIQKSKVQAEQSKPQSKDRKMSRGEILKKVFGHLGKYRICWQQSASPLRSTFRN